MALADALAGDVLSTLIDVDKARLTHGLEGLLGLGPDFLLSFQLGVLLDDSLEVLELVLDGLRLREGLKSLLLDGGTLAPPLRSDLREVRSGAAGLYKRERDQRMFKVATVNSVYSRDLQLMAVLFAAASAMRAWSLISNPCFYVKCSLRSSHLCFTHCLKGSPQSV